MERNTAVIPRNVHTYWEQLRRRLVGVTNIYDVLVYAQSDPLVTSSL